ncbi:MAG: YIP1 family protein [Candidatus Nanosalina sp.]
MGFVSDWTDSAREVITSPAEFFENEDRRDGFGYPLKFAAFALLVAGVFRALRTLVFGPSANVELSGPVAAGASFIGSIVGGLIGLFISAALIHIFVYLFSGEVGYSETLATLEYSSALTALGAVFSLVPLLGGLVGLLLALYGIYVQAKGLEAFHDLSFGKSLAAVLLPAVLIVVIVIVLALTVGMAMITSMAAAGA